MWHRADSPPLCLNFPSAPCGDSRGQSVRGLWGLLQDSMHLLSLDSCRTMFTARELPAHSPSLTLPSPQGFREWAKKISTTVLLTVLHLWVDTGAPELLPLLSNNMTAGSFSRKHRLWAACPYGRARMGSAQGQSGVGLAFREMSLGPEEFCLIIIIWQQWGHR